MIRDRWLRSLSPVLAAAALLVAGGCASVPRARFFTLETPASVLTANADTTKPLLRVERLAVAEPYAGRRIVYRPAPREVAFWEFHLWSQPPDKMITASVAAHLTASGLFRDVDSYPYAWKDADLVLRGAVLAFEEVDRGSEWYGHVKLFLELIDQGPGGVLWSSKIEAERRAEERNPESLIEALSGALDEAVAKAEGEMAEALGRR